MKFSCAIIVKNEEETIPRLLNSLKGVSDIVVMDTGSTDNTVKIAKDFGCNVIEAGSQFIETPTQSDMNLFIKRYGFVPTFTTKSKLFNYSVARNFALTFTKNDWVFQPDADEVVEWDLDEVEKLLDTTDQLSYRFCFQHNEDGTPGLEFEHTKFFRKSKLKWTKKVHEIHTPIDGEPRRLYTDKIYLHHWQIKSENRANYLSKLEYSILEDKNDDRNTYYLGREYFYNGQWEKAIKLLTRAIEIGWWRPELGQAYVEMGICYENIGNFEKAEECFMRSIEMNDRRREPFKAFADFLERKGDIERSITYLEAAMTVNFNPQGYLNQRELYGWIIPDKLAALYDRIGKKEVAKKWWIEAMKFTPPEQVVLNGLNWFYGELPLISIVVPTCRPEGMKRLEESIKKHTIYPNYEIIKKDGEGTAIEKFNSGVSESSGSLTVFIADDCEVERGWLENAFICFKEKFRDKGLVVFNDGHWNGTLANHWLASKNLLPELDGEFFNSAYFHNSVDVELSCRLRAVNLLEYCEEAKIIHHHYFCTTKGTEANKKDKFYELIESHSYQDRLLLPKRLEKLGLHKDAVIYQQWLDKTLAGNPDGPERAVFGALSPVSLYEDVRYKWAQENATGDYILDIGCSSGYGSRYFRDKKYKGVDYNKEIIEFAKDQYPDATFINADINKWPIGEYNTIIIFECLEHLTNTKEMAQKLKKHCNTLLATVPYKEPKGAWGEYHLNHDLKEEDFPGFEYKFIRPDGKIYDTPDKSNWNLMLLKWTK
ncbi:MAG: glycosyltransferase [Candidatus Aenigmarchaeota archaeon]|nr:glycosyltransferase [Candidatus Aenigmarchaeota archaeon]